MLSLMRLLYGVHLQVRVPVVHAVVYARIYAGDPARWRRYELTQWKKYMNYAGVSRFYLYDTRMYPHESLKAWADLYPDVVYHDWVNYSKPWSIHGTQVPAYQHAIDHYSTDCDWQVAVDMDEYPFSARDREPGFLQRKVAQHGDGVSELSLTNYLFLGMPTTGKEWVIERITRRTRNRANNLNKPIYRPEHVVAEVHHNLMKPGRVSMELDPLELRLNHYWGLRLQHWGRDCKKAAGGCESDPRIRGITVKDTSASYIARKLIKRSQRHVQL